ncbi:hypothetical protein D3C71_985150 [compost metagenome]
MVFGEINDIKDLKLVLSKDFENVSAQNFVGNLRPTSFLVQDTTVSFLDEGIYFQSLNAIHLKTKLQGKIVVHSFDSLVIYPEAKLSNIILIAPKIYIKKGFTGTLQALASEKIILEESVTLSYPSTLILNEKNPNTSGDVHTIHLGMNSSVLGGILITTQQFDFRQQPKLTIEKDAVVAGIVFNAGVTETYGAVIGCLNTSSTLTKAGGGSYTNHLLDAIISTKRLPKDFVCPSWFALFSHTRKKVISCELKS